MFQDEARFGRIQEPKRCWAPPKTRPLVGQQWIREYTYAYGVVSPLDGVADFFILPVVTAQAMNLFLAQLAQRHADEYLFIFLDGASGHKPTALTLPANIGMATLPPYCPELNPTEHIWDEIREKFFANLVFDSLEAVEDQLMEALIFMENNPFIVQSITGFKWIVDALLKS
jgi:transposase